MKKVNNLVVLGAALVTGIVTYKVTYKILGKLVVNNKEVKEEKIDNIINFDDYRESDLLDYGVNKNEK